MENLKSSIISVYWSYCENSSIFTLCIYIHSLLTHKLQIPHLNPKYLCIFEGQEHSPI